MENQCISRKRTLLRTDDGDLDGLRLTVACIALILLLILVFSIASPIYSLWAAQYSKKVQVEDALGKKLAASELAEAEIIRARGIAEANIIISDSITDEYLKYKFIEGLNDGSTEVIYVPTESNLPILEARDSR